ncbi:MAG TPA: YhgE/Pip family protein, partial [Kineosporiaceae bacterium]
GLATAAAKVPDYTGSAATRRAEVAGDPVSLHSDPVNQARTYGEGLAPYFIPLALWVGALVTSMLLRPLGRRALASSAPSPRVAAAGWLPAAAVGLVQAGTLIAVLHFGLGLDARRPWALLAFLAVVALSFAAMLQWIGAQFGAPGRLVALVLLMLQLTSAGGTYPIETAPALFRWLHPLLPMSYVVTGLRHLLSGGPGAAVWRSTAVLVGFAAAALALTTLAARRQRVWSIRRLHPDLAL